MTDEAYIFKTEVAARKRIARGAASRVCGSKSRYVGLPSDYLSRSEKKKLNGVCIVHNLNKPMTWKMFGFMEKDLQFEYLDSLVSKYSVLQKNVAMMFGISVEDLRKWCRVNGYAGFAANAINPKAALKLFKREEFEEFLKSGGEEYIAKIEKKPESVKPEKEVKTAEKIVEKVPEVKKQERKEEPACNEYVEISKLLLQAKKNGARVKIEIEL